MMQFTTQPLKEPRGFIRLIQVLFAILAFATTSDYKNTAEVEIECKKTTEPVGITKASAKYTIEYPFTIKPELTFKVAGLKDPCPIPDKSVGLTPLAANESIDKSTTSEFYVTTGVLAFLYSLVAVLVYVVLDQLYMNAPIIPFLDLVATAVLTLFWFLGWCAWVAQWGNVKDFYYNLPGLVCSELSFSDPPRESCHNVTCSFISLIQFILCS